MPPEPFSLAKLINWLVENLLKKTLGLIKKLDQIAIRVSLAAVATFILVIAGIIVAVNILFLSTPPPPQATLTRRVRLFWSDHAACGMTPLW